MKRTLETIWGPCRDLVDTIWDHVGIVGTILDHVVTMWDHVGTIRDHVGTIRDRVGIM